MTYSSLRVEILTQDAGILEPDVTGLSFPIQAALVTRSRVTKHQRHMIVRAAAPPFVVPGGFTALVSLFPDSYVSVIQADAPGELTVSCAPFEPDILSVLQRLPQL